MKTDRRHFLHRVLAAAAATTAIQTDVFALQPDQQQQSQQHLDWMLTDVNTGESFYKEWILQKAYPSRAGAVILNLKTPTGNIIRVDICQRGTKTLGPAVTKHLEFFVMDGGEGKAEYTQEMKTALQILADKIERNAAEYQLSEQLFTHKERLLYFPGAMAKAAKELVPTIVG